MKFDRAVERLKQYGPVFTDPGPGRPFHAWCEVRPGRRVFIRRLANERATFIGVTDPNPYFPITIQGWVNPNRLNKAGDCKSLNFTLVLKWALDRFMNKWVCNMPYTRLDTTYRRPVTVENIWLTVSVLHDDSPRAFFRFGSYHFQDDHSDAVAIARWACDNDTIGPLWDWLQEHPEHGPDIGREITRVFGDGPCVIPA